MPVTVHHARAAGSPLAGADPADARLRRLVSYAALAPSPRDTQPWRFEIEGQMIRISIDESRRQPAADPMGREAHLGVGAALENLLVAAEQLGLGHTVSYFPHADDAALAAAVTFEDGGSPTRVRSGLTLDALLERSTERGEFRIVSVPPEVIWQLQAVALDRDVRLDLTDNPAVKREFAELTARGARHLGADRLWRRDLANGLRHGRLPVPRLAGPLLRLALRHLNVGPALARREARRLRAAPLVGLVSSRSDDPLGWVRSGQLLERVWLEACRHGLSLEPLHEALEVPRCRKELSRLLLPSGFYPQALLRVGYAVRSMVPRQRFQRPSLSRD